MSNNSRAMNLRRKGSKMPLFLGGGGAAAAEAEMVDGERDFHLSLVAPLSPLL